MKQVIDNRQHLDLPTMTEEELLRTKKREVLKYKALCLQLAQSYYQKEKFQFALRLMRLFPQDRNEEENKVLLSATSEMQFFKALNQKQSNVDMRLHEQCCQKMTYLKRLQGQTVFFQSEAAEQFYIILSGSVNVLIHKQKSILQTELISENEYCSQLTEKEKDRRIYSRLAKIVPRVRRSMELNMLPAEIDFERMQKDQDGWNEAMKLMGGISLDKVEQLEKYLYGGLLKNKCVATLTEGMMFGDLGLLLRQPRAATIICKEDTEFATLTGEDYRKILKAAKLQKINNQILFFSNTMLQGCTRDTVVKFSYNFVKIKIYKDTVLYKQNDEPDGIYLIKSGLIQLIRNFQESEQVNKLRDQQKMIDQSAFIKITTEKHDQLIQKNKSLQIPLAELGKGNTFGDYETVFQCKRTATAICTSDAVVWMLKSTVFQSLVHDNRMVLENLKNLALTKEQFFTKRVDTFNDQQVSNLRQALNLTNRKTNDLEYIREFDNLLPGGAWQTVCRTNNNLKNLKQATKKQNRTSSQIQKTHEDQMEINSNTQRINNLDIFNSLKQIHSDKQQALKKQRSFQLNYTSLVKQRVKPKQPLDQSPRESVKEKFINPQPFLQKLNLMQLPQDQFDNLQITSKRINLQSPHDYFVNTLNSQPKINSFQSPQNLKFLETSSTKQFPESGLTRKPTSKPKVKDDSISTFQKSTSQIYINKNFSSHSYQIKDIGQINSSRFSGAHISLYDLAYSVKEENDTVKELPSEAGYSFNFQNSLMIRKLINSMKEKDQVKTSRQSSKEKIEIATCRNNIVRSKHNMFRQQPNKVPFKIFDI